jgi:hypothetical protein
LSRLRFSTSSCRPPYCPTCASSSSSLGGGSSSYRGAGACGPTRRRSSPCKDGPRCGGPKPWPTRLGPPPGTVACTGAVAPGQRARRAAAASRPAPHLDRGLRGGHERVAGVLRAGAGLPAVDLAQKVLAPADEVVVGELPSVRIHLSESLRGGGGGGRSAGARVREAARRWRPALT